MKNTLQLIISSAAGLVIFTICVFVPAGTLSYWQGWVFLGLLVGITFVFTIYMSITNPAALQRRMHSGPVAETRPIQRLAVTGIMLAFFGAIIISALDHRYDWSNPPTWLTVLGDVLVVTAFLLTMLVVVQNNYAAATITIESGQTLASTGLYGMVRHPMYSGALLLFVGIPLALGSFWGLLNIVIAIPSLVIRIFDEEKMLRHDLPGYDEYTEKVRYRLLPLVW